MLGVLTLPFRNFEMNYCVYRNDAIHLFLMELGVVSVFPA